MSDGIISRRAFLILITMNIKKIKLIAFLFFIALNQIAGQTKVKPALSIAYSDPFEVEVNGLPSYKPYFKPSIEFGGGVEVCREWHRIEYGIGGILTFASYKKNHPVLPEDKYNTLRFSTRIFLSLQPIKKIDFRLGASPVFYYSFSHDLKNDTQFQLNNPFKAFKLFVNFKINKITTELGFITCFDPYIKEKELLPGFNTYDFYFRNIEFTVKYEIFKSIKK